MSEEEIDDWIAKRDAKIRNAIEAILPLVPTGDQIENLRGISINVARWPEDWNTGKGLQISHRPNEIPFEANAELAVGYWVNVVRPALIEKFVDIFKGA